LGTQGSQSAHAFVAPEVWSGGFVAHSSERIAAAQQLASDSAMRAVKQEDQHTMSHFLIDGTITTARLKHRLIGGAVYTDVTVRQDDGDQRRIGSMMVLNDLKHAMIPGARGRFYFHNVLGTKGIHGFRPLAGAGLGSFPGRWIVMTLIIGLLNLSMVAGWLLLGEGFGSFTFATGLICLTLSAAYTVVSNAAMRAYRADDALGPNSGKLRPAVARG